MGMKEKYEEFIAKYFTGWTEEQKSANMLFYAKGWDDAKKEK